MNSSNDQKMKIVFVRLGGKHGIKMKVALDVRGKALEMLYTLWNKDEMYGNEFEPKQYDPKNEGEATEVPGLKRLAQ